MSVDRYSQTAAKMRREYHRQWREKNREHLKQYRKDWRKNNPGKSAEYNQRCWEKKAKEAARPSA